VSDDALEFVAFDIETTGFEADAEVTVVGFARDMGCRVLCRTGDGDADSGDGADGGVDAEALQARVQRRVDASVAVSTHCGEAALLAAVTAFVRGNLDGDADLVVAYNGERYRGGFDLPFLRTRYAAHDMAWPFTELPYADLLPVIRDRFNTTVDGDAQDDLPGAYAVLVGDGLNDVDPFTDSAAVVTAYEEGDIESVAVHNAADVLRTAALGRLSRRYCSRSDYQLKSLTPTSSES